MLLCNGAQFLQITLRRNQHTSGTGYRLNNHRGDGVRAVFGDHTFEIVSKLSILRWLAARKRDIRIIGRANMIDGLQQGFEGTLIVRDPANGNTAEADTVITAFTAYESGALALSGSLMIGKRDFKR